MWEPPCGGVVGSHPDRLGDQTAGGNPVQARRHSSWMPTPRCQCAVTRYASMAELRRADAPAGHGCATALGRREAGANRTGCARCPIAGGVDIQTRQAAASRDVRNVREARGDREGVPHRSRDCRGARGSRGGLGGIPGRTRSRDTVAAAPSAPNKRPPAHVEFDTPRSPHATARQLHRGASRSNAGLYRLRRRTADRPATLNHTPARAADAVPGAADFPTPLRSPMCRPTPRSTAVRGRSLTGCLILAQGTPTKSSSWSSRWAASPSSRH